MDVLENVIAALDADTPRGQHEISAAIQKGLDGLEVPEEMRKAARADYIAFQFMGKYDGESDWGTYFGPMMTGVKHDGAPWQHPAVNDVTPEAVQHWRRRSAKLANPVLVARYADAAWDLARMAGERPDPVDARFAADAYLKIADLNLKDDSIGENLRAAVRAFDIAIQIKDDDRTTASRAKILALHYRAVEENRGWCWLAPSRLLRDKRTPITVAERQTLVDSLEKQVQLFGNTSDKAAFDPHQQKDAACYLQEYYRRLGQDAEVARLQEAVARSFEFAAGLAEPLLASAFLREATDGFKKAGLKSETDRARVLMEDATKASGEQMHALSTEMEISHADMEKVIADFVVESLPGTLGRIAGKLLTKKSDLERQLRNLAEKAPLQYLMSLQVMQGNQVVAVIGPLKDDPEGRLIHQASFHIDMSDIWLSEVLHRAIEQHDLTPQVLAIWINRQGLFDTTYLNQGLAAWFAGNNASAVHLLVPQVESAFRAIATSMGLPTTRPHPKVQGASIALNIGDLLYNDAIAEAIGEDIRLHFRALYSDPRGRNLRNRVAHGLLPADDIGPHLVRALVQSLLVLAIWKELAAILKKKNATASDEDVVVPRKKTFARPEGEQDA